MKSLGDGNTGELAASPGFLHGLTPAGNRATASALRTDQQPTEPFCLPNPLQKVKSNN